MALLLRNVMRASRGAIPRQMGCSVRMFGARHPIEKMADGTPVGEMPESIDQSAGKAYEEALLAEEGLRRFNRGPLVGPFGTVDKPAMVLSGKDERIVGCVGGGSPDGEVTEEHAVNWFNLKKNQKTMCVMCGQIFLLTSEASELYSEAPDED